ncbi:hypothetical protein [Archangium sp.]|uniref:hypothetical protein n=1 Tax=Archangium sp. TaxID=1872627 RepID=UPI00389AE7EF
MQVVGLHASPRDLPDEVVRKTREELAGRWSQLDERNWRRAILQQETQPDLGAVLSK